VIEFETLRLADYEAGDLFEDEGADYQYCLDHATFKHFEACEFILHIGDGADTEYATNKIEEMQDYGCTETFIDVYRAALEQGYHLVRFYV